MDNTFITLHRKLLTSACFADAELLKVWVWCLLRANHKDTEVIHDGQIIRLKRGQFITGRFKACEELRMGASKYRKRIDILGGLRQISVKTTNKYSIITVIKYSDYQDKERKTTNRKPTENQQKTTDNNVNNVQQISERGSQLIEKDMAWKKYNENQHSDDLPTVDGESGEIVDQEAKDAQASKELNAKKQKMVDWLIEWQGRDVLKTNRPKQLKALNELIKMKVSSNEIKNLIKEQEQNDYWKGKQEKPDFSTVVSIIQRRG